jgi:disulfide bond formation protein DsbB
VVLVAVQLFVLGLYRPPVLKTVKMPLNPPQTIISLPVQTAAWNSRATGALVVLVAVQVFVLGLYRPPVLKTPVTPSPPKTMNPSPPQTIISLPVQTAVWNSRPLGALVVLVAVQVFVLGLYRPPVFK